MNTHHSGLSTRFGGHSTAGIKAVNQDAFLAHQPEPDECVLKGAVAVIADGIGCSSRSQEASQLSVTGFISEYYSTPDTWMVKESAGRVLEALNSWLYQNGVRTFGISESLGTTFSCVIVKSNTAHLFHVGDSRIYLQRQGRLRQLTRDHGQQSGSGDSFLTRALGMDSHLEVDYVCESLEEGDQFVLTTDGLHSFLSDRDMQATLAESGDDMNLERQAERLINLALQRGSNDNLSCLMMEVDRLPVEDLDDVHMQLADYVIPPVLEQGMSIDGYSVLQVLHSSARSHLYLVQHEHEEELLVLKAPSANHAGDVHYLDAFVREQWIALRLDHPGIAKGVPRPREPKFLYNLFEYVDGTNLRQWMHDNPKPTVAQVRPIVEQISAALRAFQRSSMVHRDLKPENVMIDHLGQIKLVDFGTVQVNGLKEISSVVTEECPVGSIAYLAPEYLSGEPGMSRSDIFSLGVIVYEMLAGELPFKPSVWDLQPSARKRQRRYLSLNAHRPDLPRWLDLVLEKATRAHPADRYQALSEFTFDLRTPNSDLVRKLKKAPLLERNPLLFWKGLCVALLVLLLLVLVSRG